MNRQNNAQELSNEEMKEINGGSGLFDGLPILGDLLGGGLLGGDDSSNSNNGGEDGHGRQSGQSNSGGLLGGIL